jgi:hypothetical protein
VAGQQVHIPSGDCIVEHCSNPTEAEREDQGSISKPVLWARSKRLGGFQYAGTNKGSVRPNGIVNRLAHSMGFRWRGKAA